MTTIQEIEPLVRDFKAARCILQERLEACQNEQTIIIRRKRPGIEAAAAKTRDAKARLEAAIEANPQLFKKPRTQTIEGIKVGYQKGKGKLVIGKNAADLIKKHFPERFEDLVKTTHKPLASALQKLAAGDLQRIGCQITDTGDQILITVPKDNLDKLVDAMLQETEA
jgi:hypothetical protein